jgi:hypothetical protein
VLAEWHGGTTGAERRHHLQGRTELIHPIDGDRVTDVGDPIVLETAALTRGRDG